MTLMTLGAGCSHNAAHSYTVESRTPKGEPQFGEAVDGLQVGLSYEGYEECGGHRLRVHLQNTGDSPLTVQVARYASVSPPLFDVTTDGATRDDDAELAAMESFRWSTDSVTIEQFVELAPRQLTVFNASYHPCLDKPMVSAEVTLAYVHKNRWAELWVPISHQFGTGPLARIGPLWTGTVKSESVALTVSEGKAARR